MAIKDILALSLVEPAGDPVLAAATTLASASAAHLAVLVPSFYPILPAPAPGVFAPEMYASLYAQGVERARAEADAVSALIGKAGVAGEARVLEVDVGGLGGRIAVHGWYADLVVLGTQDPPEEAGLASDLFSQALFGSGRPVLLVPPKARLAGLPKRVALAWRPGREASRAAHDLLSLFGPALDITIVIVDPDTGSDGHGAEPGADIAAHLSRHGATVTVAAVPSAGVPVGEALLRAARDANADLLAMGGYGHSRLRELILGGATRDIFASATLPVLYSH
jgi:nucleotide-binding universal stress UspA family protein